MTDERVSFVNARQQRLSGILSGPLHGYAVISCHGMLSNKGGTKHNLLARELETRGVPMLRFDFAGLGESEGSLLDLCYSNEVEDLDAAVIFLASRGVTRIGVFGSSMGGAVALLAAARDERIVALATLAAVAHPEAIEESHPAEVTAWQTHGFIETVQGRIGRRFLEDSLAHNVISAVGVLRAPLLVLHGERDTIVPSSDGHDIASAARHASLEIVAGADHEFSDPVHLRPAMRQIAEFLAGQLRFAP